MEMNEQISTRARSRSKDLAAQLLMHEDCPVLDTNTGKQLSYGQLHHHPRFTTIWNFCSQMKWDDFVKELEQEVTVLDKASKELTYFML